MDTDVADRSDTTNTTTVGSLCEALISSVQKASMDIMAFVRRCRSARSDLAPTTRELSELQMVLELLGDHDHDQDQSQEEGRKGAAIPAELQTHLRPILTDCITAVLRIDAVLRQHASSEQQGEGTPVKWTAQGREEIRDLEKALGAYRGVLGLVSDLVSILLVSSGTEEGKQLLLDESISAGGMTPDGLRLPDVLRELRALRTSTLASQSNSPLTGQQHLALQVHLGHIIAYAETLAQSEDWDKAVEALDEAQKKTAVAAAEKEAVRGSIPVTAPLKRIGTGKESGGVGDNFIVLNKGFENLLVRDDGGRSTSLLFASHSTPEPGSLMAGGPSTGMMIMDGAGLPGMSGTNAPLQPIQPVHTRRHVGRRTSGQQQHAMIYTTEKEVAVGRRGPEEEVTEEALAFAQVPVHILGRLSLNLVGHVYTGTTTTTSTTSHNNPEEEPNPGNVSGSSDQTSYVPSLATMKTEEGYFDDGASARTSDMGSLHDGDLQFSQLDPSKQPLPPSQTTLGSQTSLGSQGTPASSSQQGPQQQQQQQAISRQLLPSLPPVPSSVLSQPLPPLPLPPSSSQQSLPPSAAPTPTPATSYPVSHNPQQQHQQQHQQPPPPVPRTSHPHHYLQHERVPSSAQSSVVYGPQPPAAVPRVPLPPGHSLREMRSISTMNTQTFMNMQKPLPRTPLMYIPKYPGPFVKTKAVVVGNFSCGKTCLIT